MKFREKKFADRVFLKIITWQHWNWKKLGRFYLFVCINLLVFPTKILFGMIDFETAIANRSFTINYPVRMCEMYFIPKNVNVF